MRIGLIGLGAIGSALVERLHTGEAPAPEIHALVRRPDEVRDARVQVVADIGALIATRPALVVECAGHGAVRAHAAAILLAGHDLLVASVGALADPALEAALREAAQRGRARMLIPSGALGGVDLVASARSAGLDRVRLTSSKPPAAWRGTPAEDRVDLGALTHPQVIFSGSAREAARLFPANANVAAAIALAGIGLDRTEVELMVDPGITLNEHRIMASGAFGRFESRVEAAPLPSNPKSSLLAALSLLRVVHNLSAAVAV